MTDRDPVPMVEITRAAYYRYLEIASAAKMAVEAIERGSMTAPVLECLKAALNRDHGERSEKTDA